MTRDQIAGEALNILTSLRENAKAGRSNKLADIKGSFESPLGMEFDTYFFFLRKFHFIGMDREACLQLTGEGEKVLDGDKREKFGDAVGDYFASRLSKSVAPDEEGTQSGEAPVPPPPPVEALVESASASVSAPPPLNVPPPPRSAERNRMRQSREEVVPPPPPSKAESRTTEQKGQEIDLRYVKYDPIGQGPLGTVYRGRHTALGLDVAIKELKDIFGYFSFLQRGEVMKRLKREICAQALVRHPNVLTVLDQNCDVARAFYVTELCGGGSLRQKLDAADGKGIAPAEAIRIFLQLCYALRASHAQGLTHGNLKPENVLFDSWGNAKISDYGLSRVIEVDAAKGMPQVFVGTGGMGYMSPEQLTRSNKDSGPASDVYGVGIMLYEMLTGTLPGRRSPLPSQVNSAVPAKLDGLFDKMTQDRRDQRYADFDAVLADFYAAFEDGSYLKKGDLILSSEPVTAAPAPAAKTE